MEFHCIFTAIYVCSLSIVDSFVTVAGHFVPSLWETKIFDFPLRLFSQKSGKFENHFSDMT